MEVREIKICAATVQVMNTEFTEFERNRYTTMNQETPLQFGRRIEKAEQRIKKMQELEEKARKLRNALDSVESQWEKLHNQVVDLEQWEKFCDSNGFSKEYTFRDILC